MDISFNNGWLFTEDYDSGFDGAVEVRLPHPAKEIPYNYIDCRDYGLRLQKEPLRTCRMGG